MTTLLVILDLHLLRIVSVSRSCVFIGLGIVEERFSNNNQGSVSIQRCLTGIGIPIIKIRWSCDSLIFNMGIPIPWKDCLHIEPGPWSFWSFQCEDHVCGFSFSKGVVLYGTLIYRKMSFLSTSCFDTRCLYWYKAFVLWYFFAWGHKLLHCLALINSI